MDHRTLLRRLLSPAGFAVALLLFFAPFVTVSCGSEAALDATFTGIDLAGGGEPTLTGDVGGAPVDEEVERELFAFFADDLDLQPLALLAALAVLVGMATALLRERTARHAGAAALAALAGVLLVAAVLTVGGRVGEAFRSKNELLGEPLPVPSIQWRYGFWLTLASLAALAAGNAWAWRVRCQPRADVDAPTPDGPAPDGPTPDAPTPDGPAPDA